MPGHGVVPRAMTGFLSVQDATEHAGLEQPRNAAGGVGHDDAVEGRHHGDGGAHHGARDPGVGAGHPVRPRLLAGLLRHAGVIEHVILLHRLPPVARQAPCGSLPYIVQGWKR